MLNALALTAALALFAEAARATEPIPLELRELLVTVQGRTRLSSRTEALAGERVRIRGYMVQMEEPPDGVFYVAPRPVFQDESGGGTGDIPPASVRVRVREVEGAEVPFTAGPIEVVGTLEVGREEDAEGRVSFVRLVLEETSPGSKPAAAARP